MSVDFKTFCIIGDPIDHSLSPAIHNAAFNTLGLNCSLYCLQGSGRSIGKFSGFFKGYKNWWV